MVKRKRSKIGPIVAPVKTLPTSYRQVTVSLSACDRISVIIGATDSVGMTPEERALTVVSHISALEDQAQ